MSFPTQRSRALWGRPSLGGAICARGGGGGGHTPVIELVVSKVAAHIRAIIKNLVGDVDGEDSPKRFDALASMLQDVLCSPRPMMPMP